MGFQFHSYACGNLVFPTLFMEEAVFFPLYILASFVKGKVPIGGWAYIWVFYPFPLIYISVFMPVPYCLDYYSFVCVCVCLVNQLCPTLATPQTVACQENLQAEYWSGLPFPSPGDLPHPGIKPGSLALQEAVLQTASQFCSIVQSQGP